MAAAAAAALQRHIDDDDDGRAKQGKEVEARVLPAQAERAGGARSLCHLHDLRQPFGATSRRTVQVALAAVRQAPPAEPATSGASPAFVSSAGR